MSTKDIDPSVDRALDNMLAGINRDLHRAHLKLEEDNRAEISGLVMSVAAGLRAMETRRRPPILEGLSINRIDEGLKNLGRAFREMGVHCGR